VVLTPVVITDVPGQISAPGSGSADLVLTSTAFAREAVLSGDLTAILTLWPDRLPGSDVPTALESGSTFEGLPRLQGIVIKKNTPQFLMDRIRTTLRDAANGTEFGAYREAAGLDTVPPPAGDAGLVFRDQVRAYEGLLAR
jgi:tripartite-type tricarboxylate transporter receptor subunit TctC